jgi:hypothetical protein
VKIDDFHTFASQNRPRSLRSEGPGPFAGTCGTVSASQNRNLARHFQKHSRSPLDGLEGVESLASVDGGVEAALLALAGQEDLMARMFTEAEAVNE